MPDSAEDLCSHSALPADVFADQADQGFLPLIVHVSQLAEVSGDERQLVVGVDGERDGDFAGGDHVDRALVLVEDIEDGLQVAVSHEHAAGNDIDDAELLFDSD